MTVAFIAADMEYFIKVEVKSMESYAVEGISMRFLTQ